jgi:hypothetical protein
MALNQDKLHEFLGKAIVDFGATFNAALIRIGDKLGLYKALAKHGPQTPAELAKNTGTTERYIREWLSEQAAGGYVNYDAANGKFHLSEEQAFAMADESSPVFLPGAFQVALAAIKAEEEITERFKTGKGLGWHEHHHELFEGTERFFRPGYAANLIAAWIPKDAGVGDRIRFEVASAKSYPGKDYDFVTFFDCLHDMGDPAGASAHVHGTLKKDGTWMIVEPFAGDRLEENLNPIGRAFYGASTLLCTPASLSQEVGLALGAQAGEKRLREVVTSGGFSHFRRATQTPFNLIFEARP